TAEAIVEMLERAGLLARLASPDEVLNAGEKDTVFSTTLSLEALLSPGQRLKAFVIVAGLPNDEDIGPAKTAGANVYLRAPLQPDHLVKAVQSGHQNRAAK